MSAFLFRLGLIFRETGQALDRLGCQLAGSPAYREECEDSQGTRHKLVIYTTPAAPELLVAACSISPPSRPRPAQCRFRSCEGLLRGALCCGLWQDRARIKGVSVVWYSCERWVLRCWISGRTCPADCLAELGVQPLLRRNWTLVH